MAQGFPYLIGESLEVVGETVELCVLRGLNALIGVGIAVEFAGGPLESAGVAALRRRLDPSTVKVCSRKTFL